MLKYLSSVHSVRRWHESQETAIQVSGSGKAGIDNVIR